MVRSGLQRSIEIFRHLLSREILLRCAEDFSFWIRKRVLLKGIRWRYWSRILIENLDQVVDVPRTESLDMEPTLWEDSTTQSQWSRQYAYLKFVANWVNSDLTWKKGGAKQMTTGVKVKSAKNNTIVPDSRWRPMWNYLKWNLVLANKFLIDSCTRPWSRDGIEIYEPHGEVVRLLTWIYMRISYT